MQLPVSSRMQAHVSAGDSLAGWQDRHVIHVPSDRSRAGTRQRLTNARTSSPLSLYGSAIRVLTSGISAVGCAEGRLWGDVPVALLFKSNDAAAAGTPASSDFFGGHLAGWLGLTDLSRELPASVASTRTDGRGSSQGSSRTVGLVPRTTDWPGPDRRGQRCSLSG